MNDIDKILDMLEGSDYFQSNCVLTKRQSATLLEHINGLKFLLNEIPELTAYTEKLEARIAALEAEIAVLKEYRDGHDPKVDFPQEDVDVIMRDGCDQFFTVRYYHDMNWFYNYESRWFADDPGLLRWYPIPPLPESPEVTK